MILSLALAAAAAAQAPAATAPLEIRFCPGKAVRPYPLDSLRGVQGLLIQNVAIVNRGSAPVTVDDITLGLANGDALIDSRRLEGKSLDAAIASGQAAKAQGMIDLFKFQFCDGKLLEGAQLAAGRTLAPGEAILLMQHPFAYKGTRTAVRVEAAGASKSIPIEPATSKTEFVWPLSGRPAWTVGAGASFHTTHRWGLIEEFALDIFSVDDSGSSRRGTGARNEDFYAYGKPVLAAADGMVVKLLSGAAEEPPMLRKPGEAMDAYYGRISERQIANFSRGELAIFGDSVVIDHGNGEFSAYVHLKPGSITVRQGQAVKAGQTIGALGSSGNSTEPHLHFQVCDGAEILSCASISPRFSNIELPMADGDRPLQSGDVVRSTQAKQ
jgi:murein DD-endopeptidase MepM/ murein hydrolase activator NlpD